MLLARDLPAQGGFGPVNITLDSGEPLTTPPALQASPALRAGLSAGPLDASRHRCDSLVPQEVSLGSSSAALPPKPLAVGRAGPGGPGGHLQPRDSLRGQFLAQGPPHPTRAGPRQATWPY